METNHLRHPGGEPLPDLLQHGGLWGGRHETLRISFDDKQPAPTQRPRPLRLYLDDLRLGRRADEERGGGVGSEDVGPRRLVAPRVVAVAGVVPATRGKTIKPDQRKGVCVGTLHFRRRKKMMMRARDSPEEVLSQLYGPFGLQVAEAAQEAGGGVKGRS